MRVRLLALLPVLAAVAFLGLAHVRADDSKDEKKPDSAKKDDAKKDDAKKDGSECDDGCCSKPAEKVSEKQMECSDCAKNAAGPCEKCKVAVKSGAVSVVPIKGMMCPSCSTKVAKKIDALDAVAKYLVSSEKNVAVLMIAPGKALTLTELTKALEGTPGQVDDEAALKGQLHFTIDCGSCPSCPMCPEGAKKDEPKKDDAASAEQAKKCAAECEKMISDAVSKLDGVEKVTACTCEKTGKKFFTVALKDDSKVSIKSLRDALAANTKARLADLVFLGPKVEGEAKKSSS